MTLDARLRRFLRQDESGTLMAEAVLVLPFMLWSYLALFVYWDSYRAVNTVQKAAYTVSDMISREMVSITEAYIVGMDAMMEYLIDSDRDAKTRVSSITWSQLNNRYEVQWSRSPGNAMPQLTTATVAPLADRLPTMHGDPRPRGAIRASLPDWLAYSPHADPIASCCSASAGASSCSWNSSIL